MFWSIFFDSLLLIAVVLAAGWVVASLVARVKRSAGDDDQP
ncbi:MAG: hypothetical protein ACR2QQ_10905 [Gammaproteobacteria bacterium]